MHLFLILGSAFHATILATLSFFVLFAASKTEGVVRTFGNMLGIWLLVLAVIVIAGCIVALISGNYPFGVSRFPMMDHMGPGWMHRYDGVDGFGGAPGTQPKPF